MLTVNSEVVSMTDIVWCSWLWVRGIDCDFVIGAVEVDHGAAAETAHLRGRRETGVVRGQGVYRPGVRAHRAGPDVPGLQAPVLLGGGPDREGEGLRPVHQPGR